MTSYRKTLSLWLTVLFLAGTAGIASAQIALERDGIKGTEEAGAYRIQIPLKNGGGQKTVGDLDVSLLDGNYQTLARVKKKIFVLNGQQTEEVALPVAGNAPPLRDCIVRVDFNDQIWIKRFQPNAVDQELHILGQNQWIEGSRASLRVVVSQSAGGAPIAGAKIRITAQPESAGSSVNLAEAVTDADGSAGFGFTVPETLRGACAVTVAAESEYGKDELATNVQVLPSTKILLVTDKPVYQPGQLMHIRGLATHSANGEPLAEKDATLEVYDGKGNKVFKKETKTSEFGIVFADFQLADEVNQGEYRVKAILEESSSEKTAQVFEYVLPKFRVTVENERKFYAPGDKVKGYVEGKYFFGKALDDAKVTVVANCFDVGFNEFAKVEGKTNAEGKYEYEFEIPERLVGQPSFQGNTLIQMDVRVRDTADHEEQKMHTFHVATDPLQIEAIPESGNLAPGVDNEIFLVASRPDGSVASPALKVTSKDLAKATTVQSDSNGIATITIRPATRASGEAAETELKIEASLDGQTVTLTKKLSISAEEQQILLRPDKGIYRVGQTMKLRAAASFKGSDPVFLDVIKNNQTVATYTMYLKNGQAEWSLPLDNELAGTLALNAYVIRRDGNMVRDTRQVVVLRSDDLKIRILPDQEEYTPGQPAVLKIAVTGANGDPIQAALGMHIVDESVYSLSEKEPGLAKVFFAIEKELLQPKYEIHGEKLDEIVIQTTKNDADNANLSRALLSKLDTHSEYAVNLESSGMKIQKANEDLQALTEQVAGLRLPQEVLSRSAEEVLLTYGGDPKAAAMVDPWGTPYLVRKIGNETPFDLFSAGRDQTPETDDDIHSPVQFYRGDGGVQERFFFGRRFGDRFEDDVRGRGVAPQRIRRGMAVMDGFGGVHNAQKGVGMGGGMGMGMGGAGGYGMAAGNAVEMEVEMQEGRQLDRLEATQLGAPLQMEQKVDNRPAVLSLRDHFQVPAAAAPMPMGVDDDSDGMQEQLTSLAVTDLSEEYKKKVGIAEEADAAAPLAVNGQVDERQLRDEAEKMLPKDLLDSELKPIKPEVKPADGKEDKAVRVRRYFPETLYYQPELITDEKGQATVNLAMADSITTWRISAMANAKSGAIGDTTSAMKVFKPFFVDLDLPVALIQNDEVTLPVAVYNYLPQAQEVEVSLEKQPWFDLLEGDLSQKIQIAAQEVTSVTYRIRAKELGKHPLTVYAWGSQDNDAMGKEIEVRPNGEARFNNLNGRLTGAVDETVQFPDGRIEGADKLFVKIYPGVFSQIVEGLDAILQMPYGCFEQTSSTTYPNILALEYMRSSKRVTPAIEMKALEYINLGYQRLLTFEIPGGGFQVFGTPPATRILTAYGLLEFSDMSRVYEVDANVIQRTQAWLLGQMKPDGTWEPDENYAHAEMWKSIQDNKVLVTAYVAMALAQSGAKDRLEIPKAYLLAHADEAKDAYTLGLLCNALLALDRENATTKQCVQRLVDLGKVEKENLYWEAEASMSFARGDHASVEATAWAVLALIEDGRFPSELGKAINWLIEQKDPNGTWGTTHGTVLALKALVRSLGSRTEKADASVIVSVNGKEAQRLRITPENSDVFHQIDITGSQKEGSNQVQIKLDGQGQLLYQIVGKYFVPWTKDKAAAGEPFAIQVKYDRSELRRNDTVTCQVTAKNNRPAQVEMVMIDLGIPPGFRVETPVLDDCVKKGTVAKYTQTSRQLLLYIESMKANEELKLDVPMKATLPIVAKAPESTIYEYYNPEQKETDTPQEIRVE